MNTFSGPICRLDKPEETISELGDRSTESLKLKSKRTKTENNRMPKDCEATTKDIPNKKWKYKKEMMERNRRNIWNKND